MKIGSGQNVNDVDSNDARGDDDHDDQRGAHPRGRGDQARAQTAAVAAPGADAADPAATAAAAPPSAPALQQQ